VIILIPAVAWWRFGLNEVAAFWFAHVVTRPLGASTGAGTRDRVTATLGRPEHSRTY
jgi:uncharacterized membrane-anchored protein